MTDDYECPQCGLPLMKEPGRDAWTCIACATDYSGTALVMLRYSRAREQEEGQPESQT